MGRMLCTDLIYKFNVFDLNGSKLYCGFQTEMHLTAFLENGRRKRDLIEQMPENGEFAFVRTDAIHNFHVNHL